MKKTVLLLLLAWTILPVLAQRTISLESVIEEGAFSAERVAGLRWTADGRYFTRLESNAIRRYDVASGQFDSLLLSGETLDGREGFEGRIQAYELSPEEGRILLLTGRESIYRHSYRTWAFAWDGSRLQRIFDDKLRLPAFSPDGSKVSFVYENDLYFRDLESGKLVRVTTDGQHNAIINGAADWVYEEEFGEDKAYSWSPDGRYLAYYRFDETAVPEFTYTNFQNGLYPENVTFKYPKVGEPVSQVSLFIFDTQSGQSVEAETGLEADHYIPRIKWTQNPGELCIYRVNRHQNTLEFLLADAETGSTRVLMREINDRYITRKTYDQLFFLEGGNGLVFTSERDGWLHLYHFNMEGELVRQLTSGNWEVDDVYGVDSQNGLVFFNAARMSPLQREVYSVDLKAGKVTRLSERDGWNEAVFSPGFQYFVQTWSDLNTPPVTTLCERSGKVVRVLADNSRLGETLQEYGLPPRDFFQYQNAEGIELNGWMIRPAQFDEREKHPVLVYVYGGPGRQEVKDQWLRSPYYGWFHLLAQQGFIIVCIDNQGTGGRGEDFMKRTYLKLGELETRDLIDGARYLAELPYVDPDRIGIFGWSYGGYLSSLAILKGNDVFKAAIAVAPVVNWQWYDAIYTELYMRTVVENEDGYFANSPNNFAERLKGNYLLVHGMGDDNVHFQNSVEMVNALVAAGKQFDSFFYPNRNHSIYGNGARMHLFRMMTGFLEEKLREDHRPIDELD